MMGWDGRRGSHVSYVGGGGVKHVIKRYAMVIGPWIHFCCAFSVSQHRAHRAVTVTGQLI